MRVAFFSYTSGEAQRIGSVGLDQQGRVVFDGVSEKLMKAFHERGVVDADGQLLFPQDGAKFVRALPVQYSGSYFRAVMEEA